jgi:hypothetical protein
MQLTQAQFHRQGSSNPHRTFDFVFDPLTLGQAIFNHYSANVENMLSSCQC